ncbi:MAG: recombinase RarA, partial [Breznakiellaceae bacterium]
QYLPRGLQGRVFYTPSSSGYEASIRDQVLSRRELVAAMALEAAPDGATPEGLSWAAATRDREGWYKRIQSDHSSTLIQERDLLFSHLTLQRHHRVLVAAADTGLLLWEAHRRTPEGLTAGIVRSEEARKALLQYGSLFGEEEQPRLLVIAPEKVDISGGGASNVPYPRLPSKEEALATFDCATFDALIGRDLWRSLQLPAGWEIEHFFTEYFRAAKDLLDPRGTIVIIQALPSRGQRLAELLDRYRERWRETNLEHSAQEAFVDAEASFWAQTQFSWGQREIETGCGAAGFSFQIESHFHEEERLLTDRDLETWFNVDRSSWGRWIGQRLPPKALQGILDALKAIATHGPVLWRWESILLIARRGK